MSGEDEDTSVQFKKTKFLGNTAGNGGAILTLRVTLRVIDSSFTSNTAIRTGGAIVFLGTASVSSIVGSSFERNTADVQGDLQTEKGRSSSDPFDMWTSGQQWIQSSVIGAGAVFIQAVESFRMIDNEFRENRAQQGGAVVFNGRNNAAELILARCLFQANEARASGGAVHVNAGSILICEQNEFHDNSASAGGAICLETGSKMRSFLQANEQVLFQNNSAVRGGAINCYLCGKRL